MICKNLQNSKYLSEEVKIWNVGVLYNGKKYMSYFSTGTFKSTGTFTKNINIQKLLACCINKII